MRNPARIPGLRIGLQQVAAKVGAMRRREFVNTISSMRITFGPDKDRANQALGDCFAWYSRIAPMDAASSACTRRI